MRNLNTAFLIYCFKNTGKHRQLVKGCKCPHDVSSLLLYAIACLYYASPFSWQGNIFALQTAVFKCGQDTQSQLGMDLFTFLDKAIVLS